MANIQSYKKQQKGGANSSETLFKDNGTKHEELHGYQGNPGYSSLR